MSFLPLLRTSGLLEASAVGQLRYVCTRGLTRSPNYASAQALLQLDWLFLSSSPFGLYVWSLESSACRPAELCTRPYPLSEIRVRSSSPEVGLALLIVSLLLFLRQAAVVVSWIIALVLTSLSDSSIAYM